ncbi:MAG TPA: family 20 glycosylhydrolase [Bacteroidales bacterium]|mgnify:CR=1 FL=1|nr:family 20 glycosylhydrolase [Bacteroidales bacterium]HPS15893.1 family 20 glycosylhydrolase [Bacteroidales bacterium]
MKSFNRFLIFCFLFLITGNLFSQEKIQSFNLMPVPEKVLMKTGTFRVDTNFTIAITGNPDKRIYPAATRMLQRLGKRTTIVFKQGYLNASTNAAKSTFTIQCDAPGKVEMNMNESYELNVSADFILLKSPTDIGALRGLETLLQFLSSDEKGYYFPCVEINDKPRFPWRGLLIDVCRHFYPVDMIKRNLDAMAAVKMNVLHFHLSEDQGFRIECKTFPKLHELGSNGLYYTQEQVKDVIQYADARGIRVVPEFDMPGHTSSWFVGYPQLASLPGPYKIGTTFGAFDASIDPTKNYTYKFLSSFIEEMSKLFPDEYFHIGGDENNGKNWDSSATVQAFMKKKGIKTNDELQKYFNKNILKIITKCGKKMMGWDEIFVPGLPNDIVIQSWRGLAYTKNAANKGYQTILSSGYYIDLSQTTESHYLNDPLPDTMKIDESAKKYILGGEATMWSELTTDETVDSRIWPRTAAIAERLWSPSSVKNVDDMYRRIDILSIELEELGITHIKNRDMMMRRMVGSDSIEVLKTFIGALTPLKGYKRHSVGRTYTTTTPLSRIVDIAIPDEPVARRFNQWVKQYLETNDDSLKTMITKQLGIWKNNHVKMIELIKKVPALKEVDSVSYNISVVAEIGFECMKYFEGKQKPDENWIKQQSDILKEIKKPKAEVDIAIIPSIEKMLEALKKK